MINYEITRVQEKVTKDKVSAVIFVKVETIEIKSTGFSIEVPIEGQVPSKEVIEKEIMKKIEYIKGVERKRQENHIQFQLLKKQFIGTKGQISATNS